MPNFVPHVGLEFRTSDEAWAFWLDKKHKARKKRENKATSQFGEAGNNDVVHGQEAVSGGAQAQEGLSPLFPEPFNSSGAQAQAHA